MSCHGECPDGALAGCFGGGGGGGGRCLRVYGVAGGGGLDGGGGGSRGPATDPPRDGTVGGNFGATLVDEPTGGGPGGGRCRVSERVRVVPSSRERAIV